MGDGEAFKCLSGSDSEYDDLKMRRIFFGNISLNVIKF